MHWPMMILFQTCSYLMTQRTNILQYVAYRRQQTLQDFARRITEPEDTNWWQPTLIDPWGFDTHIFAGTELSWSLARNNGWLSTPGSARTASH